MTTRPVDVGIVAMEWYAPAQYVAQSELEEVDGCVGKYVTGLGQDEMGFCDDREDIGSILLTVCSSLLKKYKIDASKIGRLEVGTETLVDKSKSIKTSLVETLGLSSDVEGVTSVNACYGGTAAVLNSHAWVESSAWDGRLALVACGDIAVYEAGPARPSGGCGAFACLIGPNAPLVILPQRATCALDVWDFYKPKHSEYAMVDGKLSQACYLKSVDQCYAGLRAKTGLTLFGSSSIDFCCMHAPYNKLTQKGFARTLIPELSSENDDLKKIVADLDAEASLTDKALDAGLRAQTKSAYASKVGPSTLIPKKVGNSYTASLYLGLCSLVGSGALKPGHVVLLFSYGSGSMATMFLLACKKDLASFVDVLDVESRLNLRTRASVAAFNQALQLRELAYGRAPYAPEGQSRLAPGTYYLQSVDDKFRRVYALTSDHPSS